MEKAGEFTIHVEQAQGYEFNVRFDKDTFAPVLVDEPPPLGNDRGPNAARLLAAAIGNCLSASLVFCLSRKKVSTEGVTAAVHVELVRNDERRLRIGKVDVKITSNLPANDPALGACLEVFEDFCVVTQSVRQGIQVNVEVVPQ